MLPAVWRADRRRTRNGYLHLSASRVSLSSTKEGEVADDTVRRSGTAAYRVMRLCAAAAVVVVGGFWRGRIVFPLPTRGKNAGALWPVETRWAGVCAVNSKHCAVL